jgi:NADH-quinone oxidoreductase subunit A
MPYAILLTISPSYGAILVFLLIAAALTVFILAASAVIGPRRVGPEKGTPYESGMPVIGDARHRFNVRFYIIAVLFLLFDVELAFLWPWGVLFRDVASARTEQAQAMIEQGYDQHFLLAGMGIFLLLLLIGFVYEWKKGAFRWS